MFAVVAAAAAAVNVDVDVDADVEFVVTEHEIVDVAAHGVADVVDFYGPHRSCNVHIVVVEFVCVAVATAVVVVCAAAVVVGGVVQRCSQFLAYLSTVAANETQTE